MMRTSRRTERPYWAPDPAPRARRRTQAEMLGETRTDIEALNMDEAWMRCIAELEADPNLDADNRRWLIVLRDVVGRESPAQGPVKKKSQNPA